MGGICEREQNALCFTACSKKPFNTTLCDECTYIDCFPNHILSNRCALGVISFFLILNIIIGAVGNVCVCLVIVKQSSMRTPTNYYLFSLAVSDLFILLCAPLDIHYIWYTHSYIFGITVCRIHVGINEIVTYASSLTVMAFSIERYIAITKPFRAASCVDPLKRTVIIISGIWVFSIACSFPLPLDYAIENLIQYPPHSGIYSDLSPSCDNRRDPKLLIYMKVTTVIFFFIPMAILTVTYTQIARCLRKRKKSISRQFQGQLHGVNMSGQERTTVSVLGAVVILFFICWLPLHLQRLITWSSGDQDLYITIYLTTEILMTFSATINPLLYSVMSKTYRKAFKEMAGRGSEIQMRTLSLNSSTTNKK